MLVACRVHLEPFNGGKFRTVHNMRLGGVTFNYLLVKEGPEQGEWHV